MNSRFPSIELPKVPLVLDASVVINLLGTGIAESVLRNLSVPVFMADDAYREVRRHPIPGEDLSIALGNLTSAGLIELITMSTAARTIFHELTADDLAGGLDDGEAATIAVAIEHFGEAVAVIDEKKASRIFLNRWSDRVTVDTVTLLAQADNRLSLDKNILADACFSALIHARMRVSREAIDWVIDLIGADRADRCPSLSAYAFTFPTHRE